MHNPLTLVSYFFLNVITFIFRMNHHEKQYFSWPSMGYGYLIVILSIRKLVCLSATPILLYVCGMFFSVFDHLVTVLKKKYVFFPRAVKRRIICLQIYFTWTPSKKIITIIINRFNKKTLIMCDYASTNSILEENCVCRVRFSCFECICHYNLFFKKIFQINDSSETHLICKSNTFGYA